jgi:GNAT superfamily N-acetyltransferase
MLGYRKNIEVVGKLGIECLLRRHSIPNFPTSLLEFRLNLTATPEIAYTASCFGYNNSIRHGGDEHWAKVGLTPSIITRCSFFASAFLADFTPQKSIVPIASDAVSSMLPSLRIIQIQHGSPAYQAAVDLRHEVLRKPIGLAFPLEELAMEHNACHFVAYVDQQIVGTLFFTPLNERQVQLRQMAVVPELQHQGIGRMLLAQVEAAAWSMGYTEALGNARAQAIGFYEKAGYQVIGAPFLLHTVPHRKIWKNLLESPSST